MKDLKEPAKETKGNGKYTSTSKKFCVRTVGLGTNIKG